MASDSIPTCMTRLGDDMVLEILVRLPCYKIVMMCRSVCKQWFTVISHHSFGNRFLHHHGSKESMLATTKRKRIEREEDETESVVGWQPKKWNMASPNHNKHHHCVFLLDGDKHKEVFWYMTGPCCKKGLEFSVSRLPLYEGANLCMVAAWNDLILCMSRGSGVNQHKVYPNERYFIYNPFTKQGNWLPPSPVDLEICPTIGLICDPCLSSDDGETKQGFVPKSSYRYWVVFFDGKDEKTKELEVRMFSSCTRKWSRFFVSSPKAMRKRALNSLFVIGRKIYTYSSTTGILGFDPCTIDDTTTSRGSDGEDGKEKHVIEGHFIEWPCGLFKRKYLAAEIALKSGSDNESLLSQLDFSFMTAYLRVWCLEDYNNGEWWLKHSRCVQLLENYDSCFTSRLALLCRGITHMNLIGFHQTGGDVDDDGDVVYVMAQRRIVMCNLREGNMQLVGRLPDKARSLSWNWTTLPLWPTPLMEQPLIQGN